LRLLGDDAFEASDVFDAETLQAAVDAAWRSWARARTQWEDAVSVLAAAVAARDAAEARARAQAQAPVDGRAHYHLRARADHQPRTRSQARPGLKIGAPARAILRPPQRAEADQQFCSRSRSPAGRDR
jgi:hypothetical protein